MPGVLPPGRVRPMNDAIKHLAPTGTGSRVRRGRNRFA